MKPKSVRLSIFLIKKDWPLANVLDKKQSLDSYSVRVNGSSIGDLHVKQSKQKVPPWAILFQGSTVPHLPNIPSQSAAAVWLIRVQKRLFGITFGYGRALLAPGCSEEDFGLKVTLNCVDIDRVRSVDRVKLDAIAQHSQIQASREASIGDFGLDVEQDLLRAVTGKPLEPKLGLRLTGKDSLHVNVKVNLDGIAALLARYLAEYSKRTYRERFPWVDQIHELQDPAKIEQLEKAIVQRLRNQDLEHIWLTIPEPIDWSRVSGFKYSGSRNAKLHEDIHFTSYFAEHGDTDQIRIETLKYVSVLAISGDDGNVLYHWPLFRCIYAEIRSGGHTYLLNNGKWYRISQSFARTVEQSYKQLGTSRLVLPDYHDGSETEYNARVANEDRAHLALMDTKLIEYPGMASKVEFCDLYSRSREIIHVKRYGGSSVLSHLFAQGLVSGELFRRDEEFRRMVNAKLPASHRLGASVGRIDASRFEIVYAIVSKSTKALNIPFFSKVNLRNADRRLKTFGYRVSLLKVQAT